MKKLFMILLLIGLLADTEVEASLPSPKLDYYIGLTGQIRQIKLHERFGGSLLNTPLKQIGLFGGFMINDLIGFEAGYDYTFNNTIYKVIGNGDYIPGSDMPIKDGHTETYKISHYINGVNLGFIAYVPVYENTTYLFLSGGASYIEVNSRICLIKKEVTVFPKALNFRGLLTFSDNRFIPYLKTGIMYLITDNTAVRFTYDWKNLNKFKLNAHQSVNEQNQLKYHNSFGYGIGLIYAW